MKKLNRHDSDAELISEIYKECHYNNLLFSDNVKITYLYPLYGMDQIWRIVNGTSRVN